MSKTKPITRRSFISYSTAVAVGSVGAAVTDCRQKPSVMARRSSADPDVLKLIHVTDTHLDLRGPKTLEWVEALVKKINREHADVHLVLFGGDNFNNNAAADGDALRFKQLVSQLKCPWYAVRGNKESSPTPKTDPLGQADFARMFFSADLTVKGRDWRLKKGPFTILGIDTTVAHQDNGVYTDESLAFVEQELKTNPERHHILLNHQTYGNFWGGTERKDLHKYVLNNVAEVKKRLFGYPNLRLTLSGHKHLDHVGRAGNVTVIATTGFIVAPNLKNMDDHRFRVLEIDRSSIRQKLLSIA